MAKTVTTGSGTVPVHKDIAKITINGSSYSLLYNNNNLDFQKPVEAFEIGSFIGSGEVEKLTSSSPNVPSGAWVLYFKTDIKVESSNPQTSYTITLSDKEGVVSDSLTAELKEKFKVEFNAKDGTPEPDTQYIENGGKVTEPPNPAQAGYTFGGWYKNADCSDGQEWNFATDTVTGNMTLYAKWVPGNGTPYMVEHYQQNVENNSYTLAGTETKYGTTGGAINANDIKKEYQGFDYVSMDPDPATIAADGNTVVKLYYNRKTYNVTFSVDGSNGSISATNVIGGTGSTSPVTVKYGGSITFTAMPNTGYAVDSWTGATVDTSNNKKATLSNVSADTTVTVKFKKVYTVKFKVVDGKGGSLQGTYGGLTKIANNNNDGSEQEFTNVSNGSTVTFNAVPHGSVPSAWEIESWTASAGTLSGGGTGTTATLTVTDNATVTVEFKKVEAVAGSNNLAWQLLKKVVDIADNNAVITIDGKIKATSGDNAGQIVINNKSLTIKGKTGAGSDILDANGLSRIFKVENGANLILENLKLTGGKATGTGDAGSGGAIYAKDANDIKIENCIITGNEAYKNGGGLNIEGTPTTITNCTFTRNTAKNGGGIYVIRGRNIPAVEIHGGTIGDTDMDSANKATGSDGNGGGIYVGEFCTLRLRDSTDSGVRIIGNQAAKGGGVYAKNTIVSMQGRTQIEVDNNDVYLDSGSLISIVESLAATGPVARARITVPNDKYRSTTKVLTGSAVNTEYRKFTVTPEKVTEDSENWNVFWYVAADGTLKTAVEDSSTLQSVINSRPDNTPFIIKLGNISNLETVEIPEHKKIMLKADTAVTLICPKKWDDYKHLQVKEHASLTLKGQIKLQGADYGRNSQYALYVETGGTAEIKDNDVTITGFKNSWSNSGGEHAGKGPVFVDGTLTMTGGTIEKNTVDNLNGSLWSGGGGGVYVGGNGKFIMKGGTITQNEASGYNNSVGGGGVYVEGTFVMEGGTIEQNKGYEGGGVLVKRTFTMTSGKITNNTSDKGKGVMVRGGSATFDWKNGQITANFGFGAAVVTEEGGTFNDHGHTAG